MIELSVVVPTYRRAILLWQCLEALVEQEFDKDRYEIIVVSDGPDVYLRAMINDFVRDYDDLPHIIIHYLPKKKGPAAARNAGWRMAGGRLIVFTDDDCVPQPGWIARYWNAYLRQHDPVAFTGTCIVPCPSRPTDYEKNVSQLCEAEFITANCACSKTALQRVDGFDEAFPSAWREDSELQFKLLESKVPVIHVPEAVVYHPIRKAGWGVSLKEQGKSRYNALLYKKHPRLYKERISRHPLWNYYLMVVLFFMGVIALIARQQPLGMAAFGGWMLLVISFTVRRLRYTRHSVGHIAEMLLTSALIPFLSVFWTLYGAWKYKVVFF